MKVLDVTANERAEAALRESLTAAGHHVADLRVRDLGEHARVEVDRDLVEVAKDHLGAVLGAGFGSAEQTNERFHALLGAGQTGLSTAFDLPTLMGYDSDHPFSKGEVGKCGVAVSSLADMEILFRGIDPEAVADRIRQACPVPSWASTRTAFLR